MGCGSTAGHRAWSQAALGHRTARARLGFGRIDTIAEDLRHNFELERGLAARLNAASASQRRSLYSEVYDEYFQQARNVKHTVDDAREIARQVRLATLFLPKDGRYLEIGAGTCRVAAQIAKSAKVVYAVEVSAAIVPADAGVEVVISDGVTIPVTAESVDLVFSNQLMEHLHPDDAGEQVRNIRAALVDGGKYVCITPNRLTGPHDVSKHFTDVAVGFHLHEYTIGELRTLFLSSGFRDTRVCVALGGEVLAILPGGFYVVIERVLARLPRRVRRKGLVRKLLDPGPVVALR